MKLNNLASLICRDVWLIDSRIAQGYVVRIARYLNGEPVSFFDDDELEANDNLQCFTIGADRQRMSISRDTQGNIFSGAPQGSIAVIPISGAIMKQDNCGAPGSDTMAGWMKDAYAAENITGIVLHINSGGGSVAGTGEFGDVITQANKPVIAYCDALMASAAYWLGCSAQEIFASHQTVEIGSIGTMIRFIDNAAALEKLGYKQHIVNADTSPDKNKDVTDALGGDYKALKVNILNPTNDIFLNHVKAMRPGLQLTDVQINGKTYQEPLTGKVYLAQAAIDNGLIDKIGSFQDAVDRAMELSRDPAQLQTLLKSQNMFYNKFNKVKDLKGKKAEEITEAQLEAANNELVAEGIEGVTLVADTDLEKLTENAGNDQALKDANTKITGLTAELQEAKTAKQTAEAAKTAAEGKVAGLQTQLDAANAKIKELGGEPAAEHTTGTKETTDEIPGSEAKVDPYLSDADAELAAMRQKTGLFKAKK